MYLPSGFSSGASVPPIPLPPPLTGPPTPIPTHVISGCRFLGNAAEKVRCTRMEVHTNTHTQGSFKYELRSVCMCCMRQFCIAWPSLVLHACCVCHMLVMCCMPPYSNTLCACRVQEGGGVLASADSITITDTTFEVCLVVHTHTHPHTRARAPHRRKVMQCASYLACSCVSVCVRLTCSRACLCVCAG